MVSNPALLTETPADPTGAVPSVAGVTEATGKLSVASENISHDLTSVPDAIVAPAAAVSPPSAAGAASGRPAEESSEDEEDEDSGDETATPAGDAPPPTAPAVKKIAVPVPAKPSGPPGGKGVAVPLNTRIVQRVIPPPPSTPPRPVAVAVAKPVMYTQSCSGGPLVGLVTEVTHRGCLMRFPLISEV